jgi:hypothetical protein
MEAVVAHFKALSLHWPGGNKEDNKNSHSYITDLRVKTRISDIKNTIQEW